MQGGTETSGAGTARGKGGDVAVSGGIKFLFRALQSRNYRLFFSGQIVSLIGTWLTITATSWLVYRLTQNASTLGLVNFCGQIPAFLMAPFAGVMVDRWRRMRLLKWTQFLSMLESFGLASVAFFTAHYGQDVPQHVAITAVSILCLLATFQGLVNAFDVPARQSVVVRMVGKAEDLPNAIALNSSMFNLARFLGPLVAGYLIYRVGEAWCFTIDGVSYLAVLAALMMMRVEEAPRRETKTRLWADFSEGLKYATGFHAMRSILILLSVVSFSSIGQSVLLPVFAVKVLHGDAVTQALLMAAGAAGSLTAAIRLAARKSILGLGREMGIAAAALGGAMVLYGFSNMLWLSMIALAGAGFCSMTLMAAGNTMLQTLVEDRMRGRVMSLFTMAFMGMMPLGSILAGLLADTAVGPRMTVMIGGVGCAGGAIFFFAMLPGIRRELRPIYVQRGILPREKAEALQASEALLEEGERPA